MRTTKTDPIIDELHAVRDEHAARFGYDVDAIFKDIRARQAASGRDYVRRRAPSIGDRTFGFYMIGVFDILGQSGKLREPTGLPLNDDPAELKRVEDNLNETAGVVISLRRRFTDIFEAVVPPIPDSVNSLPPPERTEVLAERSSRILCWGMSDSFFVAVPFGRPRHPAAVAGDIFRSLFAGGMMWFLGLSENHPIRGGMEFGAGMDMEPGEIYGQALAAAHHLESRVAGGPRIVVGPKCVEWLNAARQEQGASTGAPESTAARADLCLSMLREDTDGRMVVDGLGRTMLDRAPELRVEFSRARDNVRAKYHDFRRAGNEKLAKRYETLLAYFDERAPLWRCARQG